VIVKLVNPGPASRDITLSLDGGQAASGGRVITLAGPADGENSLTAPRAVAPATAPFASGGTTMSYWARAELHSRASRADQVAGADARCNYHEAFFV
jgi:hypothetical protein